MSRARPGTWLDFAQTRSRELREALIERYMGLAKIMAAGCYQRRADNSVGFGDYLQYARVGLVEAIDTSIRNAPCRSRRFRATGSAGQS